MWISASFYPRFFVWINQPRCSGSSTTDSNEGNVLHWPLWFLCRPRKLRLGWTGLDWTGLSVVCISFVYNVSHGSYDDW
jgi:hypothetical protein